MANNKAIQFLRGVRSSNTSTVLQAGQPFYDTTTNRLYVGNGSTSLGSLGAINGVESLQFPGEFSSRTGALNITYTALGLLVKEFEYKTTQTVTIYTQAPANASVDSTGQTPTSASGSYYGIVSTVEEDNEGNPCTFKSARITQNKISANHTYTQSYGSGQLITGSASASTPSISTGGTTISGTIILTNCRTTGGGGTVSARIADGSTVTVETTYVVRKVYATKAS